VKVERHARNNWFAGFRRGLGGGKGDEEGLGVAGGPACGGGGRREGEGGAEGVVRGEDFVSGFFIFGEVFDQLEDCGDIWGVLACVFMLLTAPSVWDVEEKRTAVEDPGSLMLRSDTGDPILNVV
jgi:hypothetical protein